MDALSLTLIALVGTSTALVGRWIAARYRSRRPETPTLTANGLQDVEVLVHDGYHPATIRVEVDRPVRLRFRRAEDNPCSARVYFAEPPLSRRLAPFSTTVVTFTPRTVGSHLFTCEEGHYRGHLIVTRRSSQLEGPNVVGPAPRSTGSVQEGTPS